LWQITKAERLTCPPEFQSCLTDIFGVNVFGEPNFKILWGQTETYDYATLSGGYDKRLYGHGKPCWLIAQWMPPEKYFTPELYYFMMADPDSGLALLGEYPQFGRYEPVVTFLLERFNEETNALEIETVPLDWDILEKAMPVILAAQELTYWQLKEAQEEQERQENSAIVSQIADELYDRMPTFYGPTSYAQQRNRTPLLRQKEEEILRVWQRERVSRRRQPKRGFFQN